MDSPICGRSSVPSRCASASTAVPVIARSGPPVDILQFLRLRTTNGKRALDVLFERRGDFGAIELNCDNTNVPLPYIDLVNEALENTIVPGPPVPQTGGTAAQLRVHPEHLNEAAYDVLGQAVYPWNLPYHLWGAEARLYLEHLGVPRYELMELFRRAGAPPRDVDIAGEQLGLSPLERTIAVGGLAGHAQRDFWMIRANWVDELSGAPCVSSNSRNSAIHNSRNCWNADISTRTGPSPSPFPGRIATSRTRRSPISPKPISSAHRRPR